MRRLLRVTGQGELETPADTVSVAFAAQTHSANQGEGLAVVRKKAADFVALVRPRLTANDSVTVARVSEAQKFRRVKHQEQEPDGWTTVAEVRVELRREASPRAEPQKENPFAKLLAKTFAAAERTHMMPTSLNWSLERAPRLKVLELAAADARQQARALAEGAGAKLGGVLAVNPPQGYFGNNRDDVGFVSAGKARAHAQSYEAEEEKAEGQQESWQRVFDTNVPDIRTVQEAVVYFELI